MADKYQVDKITFHHKAFDQLRKSDPVMSYVESVAKDRAVSDYMNVKMLKKRGSVIVKCADDAAVKKNLKTNALVRWYKK